MTFPISPSRNCRHFFYFVHYKDCKYNSLNQNSQNKFKMLSNQKLIFSKKEERNHFKFFGPKNGVYYVSSFTATSSEYTSINRFKAFAMHKRETKQHHSNQQQHLPLHNLQKVHPTPTKGTSIDSNNLKKRIKKNKFLFHLKQFFSQFFSTQISTLY